MQDILYDVLNVAVYSVIGIVLMILGNFLIDLIIPCHFPTEIKRGNKAVGWLIAGSFIGIGIILKAAIMSPATEAIEEGLLEGIGSSVIYFALGILFFIIGYLAFGLLNKKYNLNEEIGKGNMAAGTMVFGIFVGLAIVISGVIC
jgi:putative membrane protein